MRLIPINAAAAAPALRAARWRLLPRIDFEHKTGCFTSALQSEFAGRFVLQFDRIRLNHDRLRAILNMGRRNAAVDNLKTVATNKKAFHEYFVLESFECGIALSGTEVKSIRQGGVNLKDAWCSVDQGEMIIKQMHISPYDHGNIFNKDPMRNRRLLLHKREIMRLFGAVKQEGLALIPLSLYFKGSLVKVQLGLCKGKKLHDKRETAAKRDAARAIDRALKEQNRK